jgi:hypothetical protein
VVAHKCKQKRGRDDLGLTLIALRGSIQSSAAVGHGVSAQRLGAPLLVIAGTGSGKTTRLLILLRT